MVTANFGLILNPRFKYVRPNLKIKAIIPPNAITIPSMIAAGVAQLKAPDLPAQYEKPNAIIISRTYSFKGYFF